MTTDRDAELSALLDGALSAHEESALRDEIARTPLLAARLEELAHVDVALRALPARAVPADLRARLQARLDAEAHARPRLGALLGSAAARPPRRRAWMAGFGAAAAAAAAALLVVVSGPANDSGPAPTRDLAVEPPAATAPTALDEAQLRVLAEEPVDSSASAPLSGDVGRPDAGEQVARVEPAPAPSREPEPELELAASDAEQNEGSEPPVGVDPALDPARVAIEPASPSPIPITSAFQDAAAAPAGASTGASSDRLAHAPPPPLYVEVTDDEADALGALELRDATIVGVLDLLGELDELEAEAS